MSKRPYRRTFYIFSVIVVFATLTMMMTMRWDLIKAMIAGGLIGTNTAWKDVSRPSLVRKQSPEFNDSAFVDVNSLAAVGRVVDTPSCTIPDFDPYNHIINRTLGDPSPADSISCNGSWPMLTYVLNGHKIKINSTLKDKFGVGYCQYEEVGSGFDTEASTCICPFSSFSMKE